MLVVVAFTGTRLSKGRSRVELTRELLWRAGVVVVVVEGLPKEGLEKRRRERRNI